MKFKKVLIFAIISAFMLFVTFTSIYAMAYSIDMPQGTIIFKKTHQDINVTTNKYPIFNSIELLQ